MVERLNYEGKKILAPMVRIGTLPMRLLALDNGADIVYSQEIIDHKLLVSERIENELLETIDYVTHDGTIVFRTCAQEHKHVVLQLGTSNAERALAVSRRLENDVAGIDINMGCPKEYSVKGGMGAALLSNPEKVKDILTTLVNGISIPVTCKIRILPTIEQTLEFVKMIEKTGVSAIAVHGRLKEHRPRENNQNDVISLIASSIKIPVIANGGSKQQIKKHEDLEKFRKSCGASSVMVARCAMWNVSLFDENGMKPLPELIQEYLKYAVKYDGIFSITKYNVQQMMHEELETPIGQALLGSDFTRQICVLWNVEDYYDETIKFRERKAVELNLRNESGEPSIKRSRRSDGAEHIEIDVFFEKRAFSFKEAPKHVIYDLLGRAKRPYPIYETKYDPSTRMYHSTLILEGVHYSPIKCRVSKKDTEHEAALVALKYLKLDTDERISNFISDLSNRPKDNHQSVDAMNIDNHGDDSKSFKNFENGENMDSNHSITFSITSR